MHILTQAQRCGRAGAVVRALQKPSSAPRSLGDTPGDVAAAGFSYLVYKVPVTRVASPASYASCCFDLSPRRKLSTPIHNTPIATSAGTRKWRGLYVKLAIWMGGWGHGGGRW